MEYTEPVENLKLRLELIEMGFEEWLDKEILKGTFHFRAKKFILSLIKQREIIIRTGRSHKDPAWMLRLIDHLRNGMQACPNKDLNVARFFLQNEESIRMLLPGSYPNKRFEKFICLRDQATEIKNRKNA